MLPTYLHDVDPAEYMVGKLAELDFTLAKQIHSFAMASKSPAELVELAKAYRGVSRCVRQSVALHTQIKRARVAEERVNPPTPTRVDPLQVARRETELRRAVYRVIWDETEVEGADEQTLLDILHNALKNGSKTQAFYETPLDDQVMDLCAGLGLSVEKAAVWRDLPDRPDEGSRRPERVLHDRAEGERDDQEPRPASNMNYAANRRAILDSG